VLTQFFFEKNIHFNFFETFNVNRFDFEARIYDVKTRLKIKYNQNYNLKFKKNEN